MNAICDVYSSPLDLHQRNSKPRIKRELFSNEKMAFFQTTLQVVSKSHHSHELNPETDTNLTHMHAKMPTITLLSRVAYIKTL